MGRGGRIHIDRISFGVQHDNYEASQGGKTKPLEEFERAMKRYKYDSDEMSDDEEEIEDMQNRYRNIYHEQKSQPSHACVSYL
jgi:hypothetical protein